MAQKIASLYAEIGANTKPLEDGLKRTRAGLQSTGKEADNLDQKIGRFAKGFGKFAVTAGVTALGAALVESTRRAAELETTFAKIGGLTGTSASAIAGLKEGVISLSRDLPVSANELGKALYFVSSSGFQGAEAMGVLEASARASAAGLGETQIIADAVTSALNAYGLGAKDATRITDLLTLAVKEGKGEPAELASSLGRVLPVAAAAGVSMEQVAAALSVMTRTGLSADEAATALRGTIGALLAPAKQSKDALGEIGLTTQDVATMLKSDGGLVKVLEVLMQRTGGNVEQLDAIIPNIRALTGVLSSAGSQGEDYARILKEMGNAAGTTDKAFQEMSKTMEFKLKKAQNSVEALGTTITSKLLPGLGDAADAAGTLLNWSDKMDEAIAGVEGDLRKTARSWEEYAGAVLGASVAAGKLTQSQADLILSDKRVIDGGIGKVDITDRLFVATGLLTRENFKSAQAYAEAEGQLDKYDMAVQRGKESIEEETEALTFNAIETENDAKAKEKLAKAVAEAMISQSDFVESITTKTGGVEFDPLEGARRSIEKLEQLMTENPQNAENYAAKIRGIKSEFDLISVPAEAAARSFQTLESLWLSGSLSTTSYAEALGNIQRAAADGEVSVDELGLKTGEAAAYMATAAGNAKTAQEGIVNDARTNKEKMLDEFAGALKRQQGTLEEKISTSMISVSTALSTARSLSTTEVDKIIENWNRIPGVVTTEYIITTTGSPPGYGGGASAQGSGPGFATGADFVVPPGYPNDSFKLRAQSGERVTITPSNNFNNTINAAPGMDETAVASKISQRLARQLRSARATTMRSR